MTRDRWPKVVPLIIGMVALICAALASGAFSQREPSPAPAGGTTRAGAWTIEVVDFGGDVGQDASLAIDAEGMAHIAYYDADENALKYAHQIDAFGERQWVRRTVDRSAAVGQFASLALDPETDQPAIAYFDNSHKDLKLAWLSGSTWLSITVAATGDVGYLPSLAVRDGWAHVAYADHTAGTLVYRQQALTSGPSFPLVTTVDRVATWPYASLALRSDGDPRISYYDGDSLNYARSDDGGTNWYTSTIEEGGGRFNALDLGPPAPAHISYFSDSHSALKVARWYFFPGEWFPQTVDGEETTVGHYTSLAIAKDGRVGVSYQDIAQKTLKFAERVDTGWHITVVDAGPKTGYFTSLAYDAAGRPHIAYYDSAGGQLMHACRDHAILLPLVVRDRSS